MPVWRYSGNWASWLEASSSTVSQNIAGNSSVVKVDVWIGMDGGWSIEFGNTYGNTVSVTVNGQTQTLSVGPLYLNGSKKHLGSLQFTVGHNGDGTGSANISLSSNMSNIAYSNLFFGNASGSFSHGFATIPRASSFRVGDVTIGSPASITIDRKSSSFTHTVRYAFGSLSGTVASGVGTSASWAVPTNFANQIPNNVTGTGTLYLDTYSGSTKIATSSIQFTARLPDSFKPTLGSITAYDMNDKARSVITGNSFLQLISNIRVTFNSASGTHGSTIKSYRAELVGKNQAVTDNNGTLGVMDWNGTATISATVTDSRGRTSNPVTLSITVIPYHPPALSFTAYRTQQYPNVIQVSRTIRIAPVHFNGANRNSGTLTFRVAPYNTQNWTTDNGAASQTFTNPLELTNSAANLGGSYASASSFQVEGRLVDQFFADGKVVISTVGGEAVVHAYDKRRRFGVGKIPEFGIDGSLDVAGQIFSQGKRVQEHALTAGNPALGRITWNNTTSPDDLIDSGFYWVSKSTPSGGWGTLQVYRIGELETTQIFTSSDGGKSYARQKHYQTGVWTPWKVQGLDNFYPVGSIYITVNNTNPSTFMGGTWERFANGRTLVGVSESESEFNTGNKTGGSKTHTLTVEEIPPHSHAQYVTANDGTPAIRRDWSSDGRSGPYPQGINTGNTGGGRAHNNLQPYIAVYMWKRTA